jgi:signal peptidase I
MSGVVRRSREVALTTAAVAGALCLVLLLVGLVLGVHPLVFRSGSMAPAIDTGALALARTVPAAEVQHGDVVSVLDAGGTRVTHRVVSVAAQGEQRQLTLKGDANQRPDAEVYTVTEVQRVFLDVPRLGYVVGWLTGPIGLFLLGLYAALLLSVALRRGSSDRSEPPAPRSPPGRRRAAPERRRRLPAVLAVATTAAAVLLPAPTWSAPWTDDVQIAGTTLTSYTVPSPATFTCSGLGIATVTFNWAAVSGASNYTLHYGSGGSSTLTVNGTSQTIVTLITGGTAWVQANINYGSVVWTSAPSQSRSYSVFLLAVSTCS